MRILHVFRTPTGGLFRHVRDATRGQSMRGHAVGMVCDSTTGGETAARLLRSSAPHCQLGIHRTPISRLPGFGDFLGVRQVLAIARRLSPDIIHCHGAKGGLYGRIAGRMLGIPTIYTPHGGSLHYTWSTPAGAAFLLVERLLARIGSGLHFVCAYERQQFASKIGMASDKTAAVIYNGLWPEDFAPIPPNADAADILFIGDMRKIKGVDILLDALARDHDGRRMTACLVGDGPDLDRFKAMTQRLGLGGRVSFPGRLPARAAFRLGRLLVMPSRAESFPYVVLEALAADRPIIASAVGGIPEALAAARLVAPGDPAALANALAAAIDTTAAAMAEPDGERFRARFDALRMTDELLDFYGRLTSPAD